MKNNNAVVNVAKSVVENRDSAVTLADGRNGRVVSVATSLVESVTSQIKDPEVPMWHNTDKDRDEPNPMDPKYVAALNEAAKARSLAAVDAMIMFGVELVDGMPEDDAWLTKLKYMEKRHLLDLSEYDLSDEMDLEYLYKKYVAVDNNVLVKIGKMSGISQEDIKQAEDAFRGNA